MAHVPTIPAAAPTTNLWASGNFFSFSRCVEGAFGIVEATADMMDEDLRTEASLFNRYTHGFWQT